ncbi:Predicted dehydrogenase [Singulisphaera sp. GP187]|uniref:Gfo/Idh/MocA family protein n=1 Tax=Singulisphaera sp. GP187 TaxID=1882752 RepID=UPI000927EB70|nr:Gfo/Idh/MocA family oxidoreductase [Singulisphaera sp. GP187]SIO62669.1 Predicted dehydrogenase [Singulisphaera sp. GP187]
MSAGDLRIGIVGAGQVARKRHLPGFMELPGVRVVGVCNLRRESAGRVAREFNIPKIYGNWEHLIEDDEIDAIVIGAWPYLHCPVTLAALDAGKHVLTEARMAMNAREAGRMFDHANELPNLTAMVVPSPYGLTGDAFMRSLIDAGYLGTLREVHVRGLSSDLADPETPLGWRQTTKYSGFNMLDLGILYETALRWVAPANRVFAFAWKHIGKRIDPESGELAKTGTPDSVQVLTTHTDGSSGVYRLSGVVLHDVGMSISLYGSEGTLIYDLTHDVIRGARRGESALEPLRIPSKLRGGWQVEADFVAAIRGEKPVTRTDFATGVRYMQFTEAVARSSRHQSPVALPLKEFSNPSL